MAISKTHPFFGYKRIDRGKRGRVPEPIFYDNINQLNSEFMFYTSSKWIGENKKGININGIEFKTEDYCKLMGYYLSEGSTIRRKTGRYQINIAQEKYLLEMWDDLNGLPLKKIWLGKKAIDISDNRLGKYLINFGKSNDRFVPDEIKKLSPKYIRLFLDAFIMGDGFISKNSSWKNGNFNDSRSYFTCSKKLADGLGELIIKTGKTISYTLKLTAGTEHQFKNGKYVINYNVWIINELTSQYKFFKNIEIKEREYNDFVYDVEVDKNHTILIRRNGKVIWGSNCQCILRYVTGRQRGIAERLTEYQPVDKDLLAKWSSKIFTKAEIREMAKNVSEHTVIREKMADFGNKYGNTEVERGIALDVNGKEILSKTGTSDSIYFPFDERELMKNRNLTFIHNHPSGASFSPDDILFAQEVNFKEMIVVGSKYRYTISSKVPRIWPSTEKLKAAHKIQVDKYESWYFFNTKSVAGKPPVLTKNEAWVQITHKIWQTLAKDFYLNYKRILI